MTVVRLNFSQIPYLGAFALATDEFLIVPTRFRKIPKLATETLEVPMFKAAVAQSSLIGVLSAGNSHGIVLPDLIDSDESLLKDKLDAKIEVIPSKYTALGNQILGNDNGAIVNPDLPDQAIDLIGKTMNVPIRRSTVAGLKNVGSSGVATNEGILLHPDVTEEEIEIAEEVLQVPADIGTASSGMKYVGICVVANSKGVLVGENTTGPELGRIESTLGFI